MSRTPSAERWARLGLGPRLFAAMALVVCAGAGSLLIVALLVAPAVFGDHLRRSGTADLTTAVRTHIDQAFTEATLLSLAAGIVVAVLVAGLVTWLVSRRLAAPVAELAATTTRMADGNYDTDLADPRLGPEFAAAPALLFGPDRFHPSAEGYAAFADFKLSRVEIERAHLVAGFGKIRWVEGSAVRLEGDLATLAAAEPAILAHMNADHVAAIEHMVGRGPGWRMTGIDPEGADFRREGDIARVEFAGEVRDAGQARAELVRLVRA